MTPYEIRLALVTLAKDMLHDKYHTARSSISEIWNWKCSQALEHNSPMPPLPEYPEYFTENDVIEKATRLNEFISNGK
jgi:hypothetical protein